MYSLGRPPTIRFIEMRKHFYYSLLFQHIIFMSNEICRSVEFMTYCTHSNIVLLSYFYIVNKREILLILLDVFFFSYRIKL